MAAQMNTHADGDDTTCPHAVVIVLDWINPALQMSLQAPNLGTSIRATTMFAIRESIGVKYFVSAT